MQPFISVVIPVKNEAKRLPRLLALLRDQDYPVDRREFIFVDNGSTDTTLSILENAPEVVLISESRVGSYAARNAGIKKARGDIIAFTDGDCLPSKHWLSSGVAQINEGYDLVAGRVSFNRSLDRCDHRFDEKFFLQQSRLVVERGSAATANLFVRGSVFESIGGFSSELCSGGDFAFCRMAVAKGFLISYAPEASVGHPTRGFIGLLKKSFRIGVGKMQSFRYTADSYDQVMPPKRLFSKLIRGESFKHKVCFTGIYGAVCLSGIWGICTTFLFGRR